MIMRGSSGRDNRGQCSARDGGEVDQPPGKGRIQMKPSFQRKLESSGLIIHSRASGNDNR